MMTADKGLNAEMICRILNDDTFFSIKYHMSELLVV